MTAVDPRLAVERLDLGERLDPAVDAVERVARRVVAPGPVADVLHGTWLGHPLHPMLTDVTIGLWTSAFVLDLMGGRSSRRAADRFVAFGVLSAVPTAISGLADWTQLDRPAKRVGVVHLAANTAGLACYAASWRARRRGRRAAGVAWSMAGATAATVGGWLGAHLVFARGAGVSRNAFDPGPADWVDVLDEGDLPERTAMRADAGGVPVLLYRDGAAVHAIGAVCSHLGGPLEDGEVGGEGDPVVTCPWHASRFRLRDGAVCQGPAQSPQPHFEVRVRGGTVQVRRRPAA